MKLTIIKVRYSVFFVLHNYFGEVKTIITKCVKRCASFWYRFFVFDMKYREKLDHLFDTSHLFFFPVYACGTKPRVVRGTLNYEKLACGVIIRHVGSSHAPLCVRSDPLA